MENHIENALVIQYLDGGKKVRFKAGTELPTKVSISVGINTQNSTLEVEVEVVE